MLMLMNLMLKFIPSPYKQIVWAYQHGINMVSTWFRWSFKRAIDLFDREKTHSNFDASKQILQFNETVMDIFENFILQKQPSVITKNKQIKAFVAEKHLL